MNRSMRSPFLALAAVSFALAGTGCSHGHSATTGGVGGPDAVGGEASTPTSQVLWTDYDFFPGRDVIFCEDFRDADTAAGAAELRELLGIEAGPGLPQISRDGILFTQDADLAIELPHTVPGMATLECTVELTHAFLEIDTESAHPRPNVASFIYLGDTHAGIYGDGVVGAMRRFVTPRSGETLQAGLALHNALGTLWVNETLAATSGDVHFSRTSDLHLRVGVSPGGSARLRRLRVASASGNLSLELRDDGATELGAWFLDGPRFLPAAGGALRRLGDALRSVPGARVRLEVHADAAGDTSGTSRRTAEEARFLKEQLVTSGAAASGTLVAVGMGSRAPVESADTPEGRDRNRRLELRLLGSSEP